MMSFNNLMHPRNIYRNNSPDFKELAIKYAYFRSHSRENTNGNVSIDFKNPEALRALLYALLENDFDIKLEIPLDRLIPTLPLRLNYIHWIEDLLECLDTREKTVIGIDIGTGASCIYPLLGTKINGWNFIATEVDESSVRYAQHNVKQNGFTDKITVELVEPGSYLCKPLEGADSKTVNFCMCNPPFFASEDDAILGASRSDKRSLPSSLNTGSTKETVTTGGEVEFVKAIIEDSFKLQQKITWYTSMLGRKSSMKFIMAYLKEKEVPFVTTTRFCQGKTMRWGVAWTFQPDIKMGISTSPPSKRRKKESKSLSFYIPKDSPALPFDETHSTFERALKLFDDIFGELKIVINEHQVDVGRCRWICSAFEITWSNQRRKRREQKRLAGSKTNCSGNSSIDVSNCSGSNKVASNTQETDQNMKNHEEKESERNLFLERDGVQNRSIADDPIVVTSPNIVPSSSSDKTASNATDFEQPAVEDSSKETSGTHPLCTFWVCLDTCMKLDETTSNELYVEVGCIQAANKNHVYQFYQFLHNKIVKAI